MNGPWERLTKTNPVTKYDKIINGKKTFRTAYSALTIAAIQSDKFTTISSKHDFFGGEGAV